MVFNIKNRLFFSIVFIFALISFSYGAYPDFDFQKSSLPSGQVDITAQSSSGTQIELWINEQKVGTKDIFAESKNIVLDGSDIQDQTIAIGAALIFTNDDSKVYILNISDGESKTLNFGDTLVYRAEEAGEITYKDENSGTTRKITATDELVQFNFTQVNTHLTNGENTIKFIQKYPYPAFDNENPFEYTLSYEKYPNTIYINEFENTTKQTTIKINGSVQDSSYPLYYLTNINPLETGNIGAFHEIDLTGCIFNTTISSLREGKNTIYFVTTDEQNNEIYTGLKKITVEVDSLPPYLEIEKASYEYEGNSYISDMSDDIYIASNTLHLNITTDALIIDYTFNDQNYTAEFVNESAIIDLSLTKGQNNLTLIAKDRAGNIYKEAHNIWFDDEEPELIDDSLKPQELFEEQKAHFFFQDIEGKTNKPDVDITIFTISEDAKTTSGDTVTCEDYKDMFVRNLGQYDSETPDGPEINPEEIQVSLTNLIFQKTTVTSNSDGEFDAMIGLQEKDITQSEYNNAEDKNPTVGSVESTNTICFVMQDRYGNIGIDSKSVKLDAGNTMWDPREITTIPNSVYAAEIENIGDERTGTGNIEVGIIARFQYIGAGEVTEISSFRVSTDKDGLEYTNFDINSGSQNYKLDKDTGEMVVFFSVGLDALGMEATEYPDKFDMAFQVRPTYSVDDTDIPIDTKNPIYFRTSVNVERPIEHTKWLTPEMIDKTLKFLNKSIAFTEKAVEWTGYASVAGVIGCTAAKFYHAYEISMATDDIAIQEADKRLYLICDRVACTASPPECSEKGTSLVNRNSIDDTKLNSMLSGDKSGNLPINSANSKITDSEGNVLGKVNSVSLNGKCDLPTTDGKDKGVYMKVSTTKYDTNNTFSTGRLFGFSKVDSVWDSENCVDPSTISANNFDVNNFGVGICYKEGSPFYDETRCTIPYVMEGGIPDEDPSANILSSIKCGCITDTYSHLKVYLRIQEGIKKCLQQARIGDVEGSYCERLMSQAVCDIATNIVLPEVMKKYRSAPGVDQDTRGGGFNFFDNMRKTDKAFNQRYKGTMMTKTGLQTDDLVNKVCVGAFTQDWTILTDNILTSIEQNEVDPVFGPLFPVSRAQYYNPMTGKLSIQYRFSYGVVSGGQTIKTKVTLICDPNAPNGEYCPTSYTETNKIDEKTISDMYVREDGSAQETVVLTDSSAKFWYNKIRLTHTYTLKGKDVTKEIEEDILHKGEVVAQCHFGAGVTGIGFSCDTIFSDEALLSRYVVADGTELTPSSTFYEKNKVWLKLFYDIRGEGGQDSFSVHYMATCQKSAGETTTAFGKADITISEAEAGQDMSSPYGTDLIHLFTVPSFGVEEDSSFATMKGEDIVLKQTEATKGFLRFTNQDGENSKAINFDINENENFDLTGETSFTIEKGSKKDVEFKVNGDVDFSDHTITFKNAQENVFVEIYIYESDDKTKKIGAFSNSKEQEGYDDPTEFKNLQAGSCELKLRILPQDVASFTNKEDFESYNTYGDNIETDVGEDDIFTTTFTVSKADSSASSNPKFDLIHPSNKESYCIDVDGNSVSIKNGKPKIDLLTQIADNDFAKNNQIKYTYTLTSDRIVGSLLSGESGEIPVSKESDDSHRIDIDLDKIVSNLQSSNNARLELNFELNIKNKDKEYTPITRTIYISQCDSEVTLPQLPDVQTPVAEAVNGDEEGKEVEEKIY